MATGDIRNNLRKLVSELKNIKYEENLDFEQMIIGVSTPFLPILFHVFMEYSSELTSYFLSKGYNFYGKSDSRFLESVYRILVQEFQEKPLLTKQQFFSIGFAEVKVIFVTKILKLCIKKNKDILLKQALKKKLKHNSDPSQSVVFGNGSSEKGLRCVSNFEDNEIKPVVAPSAVFNSLPLPTPELALTPIKKGSIYSNSQSKTYSELPKHEMNELKSNVEKIKCDSYVEKDNFDTLKKSTHSEDLFVKKDNNFYVSPHILNHLKQNSKALEHLVNQANLSKDEPSHGALDGLSSCLNCLKNSELIRDLDIKVQKIEQALDASSNLNVDLKARVSIMEIQIKAMEKKLSENSIINKNDNIDLPDLENEKPYNSNNIEKGKIRDLKKKDVSYCEYSPVKYTDDEEIIKDFKPISYKNFNDDYYLREEEKENFDYSSLSNSNIDFEISKVDGKLSSVDNKCTEKNIQTNILTSNNFIFDAKTSETVKSVKQRLEETERLLLDKKNRVSN
ncbi:uncharacterized protein LOC100199304 [Hydra vulgaris]|uniref:Centrosomal protein of 44 kDa n=1 Tax=Hydra vulgaris TaxID=6087 RepID=A0ABM4BRH9_HYDVU